MTFPDASTSQSIAPSTVEDASLAGPRDPHDPRSLPLAQQTLSELLDERVKTLAPLVANWRKRWDAATAAAGWTSSDDPQIPGLKDLDQLAYELLYGLEPMSTSTSDGLQVKIWDEVEIDGDDCFVLRAQCDLSECFPDDPDGYAKARADMVSDGAAWVGGGASPITVLELVR